MPPRKKISAAPVATAIDTKTKIIVGTLIICGIALIGAFASLMMAGVVRIASTSTTTVTTTPPCVPNCAGKNGGTSNGCGGTCGYQSCTSTPANTIYVKGSTSGYSRTNGATYTYTDSCASTTSVYEQTCNGVWAETHTLDCPANSSCSDGRCVQVQSCTDSDGGNNPLVYGYTSGYSQTAKQNYTSPDYCINSTTLQEGRCIGIWDDKGAGTVWNCPSLGAYFSCSSGKCVPPATTSPISLLCGPANGIVTRGQIGLDLCRPGGVSSTPVINKSTRTYNWTCSLAGVGISYCSAPIVPNVVITNPIGGENWPDSKTEYSVSYKYDDQLLFSPSSPSPTLYFYLVKQGTSETCLWRVGTLKPFTGTFTGTFTFSFTSLIGLKCIDEKDNTSNYLDSGTYQIKVVAPGSELIPQVSYSTGNINITIPSPDCGPADGVYQPSSHSPANDNSWRPLCDSGFAFDPDGNTVLPVFENGQWLWTCVLGNQSVDCSSAPASDCDYEDGGSVIDGSQPWVYNENVGSCVLQHVNCTNGTWSVAWPVYQHCTPGCEYSDLGAEANGWSGGTYNQAIGKCSVVTSTCANGKWSRSPVYQNCRSNCLYHSGDEEENGSSDTVYYPSGSICTAYKYSCSNGIWVGAGGANASTWHPYEDSSCQ